MAVSSVPLTALSEDQRAQAHLRFTIIRPALEDGISQAQVARTQNIPASTMKRWMKRYRENGLAGLADAEGRSDKGKSRRLPPDAITLIEGLALQEPPRSMAAIHRQVTAIALKQGWKPPSYDRVRHIIKGLDPALVTFAHQGAAAYREEFDLLYRREASHSNAMWQADHCELPILLLDEAGQPDKSWFTAIEDDYGRMIVGTLTNGKLFIAEAGLEDEKREAIHPTPVLERLASLAPKPAPSLRAAGPVWSSVLGL